MSWRTASSLMQLRDQVNHLAPNRSKASDGTIGDSNHRSRRSDHNPWVVDNGVGIVTAMDITHDPDDGCDCNKIVTSLVESKDQRIKYIIWNSQIISSTMQPWIWREYTGRNKHNKHFHISVKPEKEHFDSITNWQI